MQGIVESLSQHAPDRAAISAPHRPDLSYEGLTKQIHRIGGDLRELKVAGNDRVAVVLPNGPAMAASFVSLAPWCAVAPLNPAYTKEEFEFYLEDLEASALVVLQDSETTARTVAEKLQIPAIEITELDQSGSFTMLDSGREPVERTLDDVSLILHTSGTTSRPKMVPLSQRNLCQSAQNISSTLGLTSNDRCLNIMPLFHIHGLMAPVLASFYTGGSVYCTPGFDVLRFFQWLEDAQPSWYSAVPTMHQAIVARASRNESIVQESKLRFIRSSSASLPVPVLRDLETTFSTPVVEAYAMTEAAHQMCSNPLPPKTRKAGTVGPAAGPDVRISDPERLEFCGTGREGEVVIQGANVTAGYVNNAEANEKNFSNGWFRTGDLGIMDTEGYVKITGRLKELINRGGEKIAPLEVDEVLLDHPSVAQACTFAIPHAKLGEDVGAIVVLAEGQEGNVSDIQSYARERLAAFKVPRTIIFKDEIPKGATGKVQRIGMAARIGLEN